MAEEDGFVLRPPFNVVRQLSVRTGTMDIGMRATVLEVRFDPVPEGPRQEVILLLDDDLTSKLEARLRELSDLDPPARH